MKQTRCAIYTRKSSEDGLEQDFNSLDAQREACEAYIASQCQEGWVLIPDRFEDGGISGGHLDRPALQRLMAEVDARQIDQIVVYKIDRLTRSLADFAKLVDRLDRAEASFVSVTQSFNTATSMGRLTLNVLLSFAQFEREVTAERIRDKIAASKRKGLWMGGNVPLGYEPDGRTLRINTEEAETVRRLYDLYDKWEAVSLVHEAAQRLGLRSKVRRAPDGSQRGGNLMSRGQLHHILTNPIYAGRIRHRNEVYDGKHPAIIEPEVWDSVQVRLSSGAARSRRGRDRAGSRSGVSLLAGKVFDETGDRLTPTHSKTRTGKRLRYYVSNRLIRNSGKTDRSGWRLPAAQLEAAVARLVKKQITDPGFPAALLPEADADAIHRVSARLGDMSKAEALLAIVNRVDIEPGTLAISLDVTELAASLEIDVSAIATDALSLAAPFQSRKRGVETKLILGDDSKSADETLLLNVARACDWFDQLKSGRTYGEIAHSAGTSKRRVQQMVDLAFIAPDVVRAIAEGRQPVGLTSDWLLRHDLPSDWDAQRAIVATL